MFSVNLPISNVFFLAFKPCQDLKIFFLNGGGEGKKKREKKIRKKINLVHTLNY